MDELNLELDNIEGQAEQKLKVKNRFEQLSEKVILTSKERDELSKAKGALETENKSISQERDFYKDFSANVSKYPQASEYQDKILEKVKAGYSTEDAMVSVLNKEGKLTAPTGVPTQPPTRAQIEGGSAPTNIPTSTEPKTLDEKRKALMEADERGELSQALFRR